MEEFIVWDKVNKKFLTEYDNDLCGVLSSDKDIDSIKLFNCLNETRGDLNEDNTSIHQYIGETDINNKKIYSLSSIVEFEWKDYRCEKSRKHFGYFSENKDKHSLEFVSLESGSRINFIEHIDFIVSIKIIDTIQENKLGLIK